MLKRVQLIPLLAMLWCSGISLSSGLGYDDINIAAYLIPVVLIFAVYYISHAVLRNFDKRELMSMAVSFALSLASLAFLHKSVIGGFGMLYNDISYRVSICYGINLGEAAVEGAGMGTLAIGQFEAFVTILTLYFYESRRPAILTSLPSFFLFSLSIIADGVPYEACVIAYSGALIVFLGMGSRGESIRKFALLCACTAVVGALVSRLVSWEDVSRSIWSYREEIIAAGNIRSVGDGPEKNEDENKQRIDFGQFNEEGDISYNGTLELTVKSHEKFEAEQLFLLQFIGGSFKNNVWAGTHMRRNPPNGDYDSDWGNYFEPLKTIEIKSVFDKEEFVPYAAPQDELDALMQYPVGANTVYNGAQEAEVREGLRKRIQSTVLQGEEYRTVGEAVNIVKKYFGEGFTYTLQPGALQDGVDEIEWFMFSSKRGYCTHFASAAIMIFRTMGIPARMAQGYVIDGKRMITDKEVEVYDYNAHSWVEIYADGAGWIPLDVTSYVTDAEAGSIEDLLRQNSSRQNAPQSTMGSQNKPTAKPDDEMAEPVEDQEEKSDADRAYEGRAWKQGVGIFAYCLVLVPIAVAAAVLLMIRFRRKRKYRAWKAGLESEAYADRLLCANDGLMAFWNALSAPWDYLDSGKCGEKIFDRTKAYYLPVQTREQELALREKIRRYVLCVYESRFGRHGISEQEYEQCMGYLDELIRNIEEHVEKKQWKKLMRCDMVKIICKREFCAESAKNRR